ncbi:hypothetical protein HWV07_09110 [Natronomonas salina]|uniref:hypothetical protein n=1 Tax=Natronomonas salina TaxID=1710540 RepID=UPI0015B40B46|nr:hypothetical protein [Natronomonas salina]QLD89182.1 hypothetical protein HWV07_09110 [Natronomonas salina]
MFDTLLHLGIEHTDFSRPIVTALFGFVAGTGVGLSVNRVSTVLRNRVKNTAE